MLKKYLLKSSCFASNAIKYILISTILVSYSHANFIWETNKGDKSVKQLEYELQISKETIDSLKLRIESLLNQLEIYELEKRVYKEQGKTDKAEIKKKITNLNNLLNEANKTNNDIKTDNAKKQAELKSIKKKIIISNNQIKLLQSDSLTLETSYDDKISGIKEQLSYSQLELEAKKSEITKLKKEIKSQFNKNNYLSIELVDKELSYQDSKNKFDIANDSLLSAKEYITKLASANENKDSKIQELENSLKNTSNQLVLTKNNLIKLNTSEKTKSSKLKALKTALANNESKLIETSNLLASTKVDLVNIKNDNKTKSSKLKALKTALVNNEGKLIKTSNLLASTKVDLVNIKNDNKTKSSKLKALKTALANNEGKLIETSNLLLSIKRQILDLQKKESTLAKQLQTKENEVNKLLSKNKLLGSTTEADSNILVDKIASANKNIIALKLELRNLNDAISGYSDREKLLNEELKTNRDSIASLKVNFDAVYVENANLNKDILAMENTIDEKNAQLLQQKDALALLSKELASTQKNATKYANKEKSLSEEIQTSRDSMASLKVNFDAVYVENANLNKDILAMENIIDEKNAQLLQQKDALALLSKELVSTQKNATKYANKEKSLSEEIQTSRDSMASLKVNFDAVYVENANLNKDILAMENIIDEKNAQLLQQKDALALLSKELASTQKNATKYANKEKSLSEEIQTSRDSMASLKVNFDAVYVENANLNKDILAMENIIDEKNAQLLQQKDALALLSKELASTQKNATKYANKEKSLSEEIQTSRDSMASLKVNFDAVYVENANLNKDILAMENIIYEKNAQLLQQKDALAQLNKKLTTNNTNLTENLKKQLTAKIAKKDEIIKIQQLELSQKSKLYNELANNKNIIVELQKDRQSLSQKLQDSKSNMNDLQSRLNATKKQLKINITNIKNANDKLTSSLIELSNSKSSYNDLLKNNSVLQKTLATNSQKLLNTQNNYNKLSENNSVLQKTLATNSQKLLNTQNNYNKLSENNSVLQKTLATNSQKLLNTQNNYNKLSENNSVLQKTLATNSQKLLNTQNNYNKLSENNSVLQKTLATNSQKLLNTQNNYNKLSENNSVLQKTLATNSQKLLNTQNNYNKLSENNAVLKTQLSGIKLSYNNSVNDNNLLKQEFNNNKDKLKQINRQLKKQIEFTDGFKARVNKLNQEIENTQDNLALANNTINKFQQTLSDSYKDRNKLKSDLDDTKKDLVRKNKLLRELKAKQNNNQAKIDIVKQQLTKEKIIKQGLNNDLQEANQQLNQLTIKLENTNNELNNANLSNTNNTQTINRLKVILGQNKSKIKQQEKIFNIQYLRICNKYNDFALTTQKINCDIIFDL